MIIIADSSPLITLALIDKLAVLEKLYRKLCVSAAVFQEVTVRGGYLRPSHE